MGQFSSTTEIILQAREVATPWVAALLPFGYLELGILIGALTVLFIIGLVTGAFSRLFRIFSRDDEFDDRYPNISWKRTNAYHWSKDSNPDDYR